MRNFQMPVQALNIKSYGMSADQFDNTEYDTFEMIESTGDTFFEFFNHAINVDGKTGKETSMKIAGQFPKKNAMEVRAIAFQIYSKNDADAPLSTTELATVLRVLSESSVKVNIEGKDYLTSFPFAEVLPPISITTNPDTAGDSDKVPLVTNNLLVKKLAVPIALEEQVSFHVRFDTGLATIPAACDNICIKCMIKGIKVRGK